MEVKIDTRETDFQSHIGVHKQDRDGVCVSLGREDGWHWISDECAEQLAGTLLLMSPAGDIISERHRQVTAEGWTAEQDDERGAGILAQTAAWYAANASGMTNRGYGALPFWPFDEEWKKPKDARADLVRAGALILAEIERMDRATQAVARATLSDTSNEGEPRP
jgi:hypothetical protein